MLPHLSEAAGHRGLARPEFRAAGWNGRGRDFGRRSSSDQRDLCSKPVHEADGQKFDQFLIFDRRSARCTAKPSSAGRSSSPVGQPGDVPIGAEMPHHGRKDLAADVHSIASTIVERILMGSSTEEHHDAIPDRRDLRGLTSRTLEQGQTGWRKTASPAEARLVDPHQAANRGANTRLGAV